MAKTVIVHHIPKHKNWPNKEPDSVRKAYDDQLAAEKAAKAQKKEGTK
jgi:hypothetical protein